MDNLPFRKDLAERLASHMSEVAKGLGDISEAFADANRKMAEMSATPIQIRVSTAAKLMDMSPNFFEDFMAKNNIKPFYHGRIPYVRYQTLQDAVKRREQEAK